MKTKLFLTALLGILVFFVWTQVYYAPRPEAKTIDLYPANDSPKLITGASGGSNIVTRSFTGNLTVISPNVYYACDVAYKDHVHFGSSVSFKRKPIVTQKNGYYYINFEDNKKDSK